MGTLRIAIDPAVSADEPEIKYVFRTLLRAAGFGWEFCWRDEGTSAEIYYGPPRAGVDAYVRIDACGLPLGAAARLEPESFRESTGLPFLEFQGSRPDPLRRDERSCVFSNDIVYACYWLLTGAREPHYARDRWDNLDLSGSFFLRHEIQRRPPVSLYAAFLREVFRARGYEPLPFSGAGSFVFTHDVDYPQIIRWIECLRLAASRGFKGARSIAGVLSGRNHFWKFADWVEAERAFGARPAFYFMARKGSLFQYAAGTPDAFYDIRRPEFQELFRYLREEGCEIGLHASYHAHRLPGQIGREVQALEDAAGVRAAGGRHHYWHVDPNAPHDTLREHERAGMAYDSSLGFEFYPGFRRGICHPFRPYHPGERRELSLLELPPTWMDDHFDRRLANNRIADPESYARGLLERSQELGGITVVDYHARGMNRDFYPSYGAWLLEFAHRHLDCQVSFPTPTELTRMYGSYEKNLERSSRDEAQPAGAAHAVRPGVHFETGLLEAGEEERWEAFVNSHPQGSIYHTLAWKAVTEEGLGHEAFYLRARDAAGEIAGVLPLFLIKGLMGRRLVSVPMRDRGGLLARDKNAAALLVKRAVELTRELRCKYLELRSLEEVAPEISQAGSLHCERYWVTTRIDLSQGIEKIWKELPNDSGRRSIHRARKKGLRVEIDASAGAVERFYEMFVHTRRALGIPPYPRSLFLAIWKHLIAKGKGNLFMIWKDSEPADAMINLLSNDTFIAGYAAPQNQWRKLYPNDLMYWSTIEWAASQGFRYYDFGADSPRQTGLLRFKAKWGGCQHPMSYCYFLNGPDAPPNFDSSSAAYGIARKIWSILPVPVCKPLGAWVTRQLS